MNFEIIEIDNFKSAPGRSSVAVARISFTLAGVIRINKAAISKMLLDCFDNDRNVYLHLMESEGALYATLDYVETHGVYIRWYGVAKGVQSRRTCYNICGQGTALIKHLAARFDWPLQKGKKSYIKYTVAEQVAVELPARIFQLI